MPTDLNGKPFQLTFIRPAQMMLFANVVCDPPLGQTTVVPHGKDQIRFHVLIESSISFPEQPWEATLWHNCNTAQSWGGLDLEEIKDSSRSLAVSSKERPKVYRRYFSGTLQLPQDGSGKRYFEFTLKYRTELSHSWKWVNEDFGRSNGSIIFQSSQLPDDLPPLFDGFSSAFNPQNVPSQVSDTKLFYLSHSVEAAGKESHYQTDTLGTPRDYARWSAISRLWTPWLAPQHGEDHFKLNLDGVTVSFLRKDGIHLVLLALSGIKNVVTLCKSSDDGQVLVESRNDEADAASGVVLAAVGFSHHTALAACMYHARDLVTNLQGAALPAVEAENAKKDDVEAKWYEEWYDGLTYCTWNALGQNLTEKKILDALDDLAANDIHIGNLIIDDNWQDLDNEGQNQVHRGWIGFEANKKGFPDGLKETVSRIRRKQPQIQAIAVWHALLGYWGGISPDGELAKKYKTKKVAKSPLKAPGGWTYPAGHMHVVDEPDIQRMYNDFYDFLESTGVNAVKTDAQFFLDLLADPEDRRKYTKAYQDAWTISGLRHFGNRQISCMSLFPQAIFHSMMPTNRSRLMVRNSDDFFPEIPESHPWHIFTNAHTALFTQHLNVLPDWDMFQTAHPYSSFHAAGRCLSGGPIYLTDEPGKHDLDLIEQMTAKTTQGVTVILRPHVVGRVIESGVYTAYGSDRALKVGAYDGHAGTGAAILGVFNVAPRAVSDLVVLRDFPGFVPQNSYVVRAHTTGEVSLPAADDDDDDAPAASLHLPTKGWEILTAYPLRVVPGDNAARVAPLGLLGKMTGAAALLGFEMEGLAEGGRVRIVSRLKALGTLGLYVSNLDRKTVETDFMVTMQGKPVPVETVRKAFYNVLEVDVAAAWKALGLSSGWSNELSVVVLMKI